MTEEQIEQNADEYALKRTLVSTDSFHGMVENYLAGAHSRDEEIEELRKLLFEKECDIQFLEHKLRNPWISVEDRLPEEEDNPDEYNASHRARSSSDVIITDGTIINRGYYSYARIRWEWNEGEIKVTHWMPIPQIEKGE